MVARYPVQSVGYQHLPLLICMCKTNGDKVGLEGHSLNYREVYPTCYLMHAGTPELVCMVKYHF
jgi:hypothetical protein